MIETNLIAVYRGGCLFFALFGILIGLGLLLRPQVIISINNFLNAWVSTRKLMRKLEAMKDTTGWFLRMRFVWGFFFILLSLVLFMLSLNI